MTARCDLLKAVIGAGSGLTISFDMLADDMQPTQFEPGDSIRVDADDNITVTVGGSEMAQSVRASLPMIVADELGAEWSRVKLRQAQPGPEIRNLVADGSSSVAGSWTMLRLAAAALREMLLAAAAARLGVIGESLRTEGGRVIAVDGRSLRFGEIVADAAKLPVPQQPRLKSQRSFNLIGPLTPHVDATHDLAGKAVHELDARLPGVLYATLVRPPTHGGAIRSFDDSETRKVRGVRKVVRISSGVAVVGTNSWSALKGRERLRVSFDPGPNIGFRNDAQLSGVKEGAVGADVLPQSNGRGAAATSEPRGTASRYSYPFHAHAPAERVNCLAHVRGNRCDIVAPTQAPHDVQEQVARALDIPRGNVSVTVTLLGGGFGRRVWSDCAVEAAEVSRAVGAPVQMMWTGEND